MEPRDGSTSSKVLGVLGQFFLRQHIDPVQDGLSAEQIERKPTNDFDKRMQSLEDNTDTE